MSACTHSPDSWSSSPCSDLARSGHPGPVFAVGFAAALVLAVALTHPLLALIGAAVVGSKLARRHRWRRWHDEVHGPHPDGPRRHRHPGWSTGGGPRRGPSSAERAWRAARTVVSGSEALTEAEREDLHRRLDDGIAEVRRLHTAARRAGEASADDPLGAVLDRAAEQARRFEAGCERVRLAVVALEVQGEPTAAVDALGAAAEELAGRVGAQAEVDDLEK